MTKISIAGRRELDLKSLEQMVAPWRPVYRPAEDDEEDSSIEFHINGVNTNVAVQLGDDGYHVATFYDPEKECGYMAELRPDPMDAVKDALQLLATRRQ